MNSILVALYTMDPAERINPRTRDQMPYEPFRLLLIQVSDWLNVAWVVSKTLGSSPWIRTHNVMQKIASPNR